jgi:hypothetical protein
MSSPEADPSDPENQEITPTPSPVSSYACLEQAIEADKPKETAKSPSMRPVSMLTRLAALTVLTTALGNAHIKSKNKTPNPPTVIQGSAGEGGHGETEKCVPGIAPDGRPVQEGTCTIIFALGTDTAYSARLENARILVDSLEYEVEIDYGAVRGISGVKHPQFLVHGSEHFFTTDIELKGVIWVENTPQGKVATVKAEDGKVILQTSWGKDFVLKPGQAQTIALEAPDTSVTGGCSIRWKGKMPPKNPEMWLALLGALAVLKMRRKKN